MAPKTGGNDLFSPKKLKQSPEALPLMNGGLKSPGIKFGFRYNSQSTAIPL